MNKREIHRPGDLQALGVHHTVSGNYSNTEIFEQLCQLKNELENKFKAELEKRKQKK